MEKEWTIEEFEAASKAYLESDEYKKEKKKNEHIRMIKNKYIKKFHSWSPEQRLDFCQKLYDKYTSKAYLDREYEKCYEPRCELDDLLFEYAVYYGKTSLYDINDKLPEEQYEIDGRIIVGRVYGQGDFIYTRILPENALIPHWYDDTWVYDEHDNVVVHTSNGELPLN